ncbi:MAG: butyryl-CoA:acetate CoA-transferase [Clostridia bacterium]|nr:butyryl-CoA:acetate CoA-transferase [Clostridia bacterium]
MNYMNEYQSKLRTPEDAVKVVKSGDWVEYPSGTNFPVLCDAALAKRRDELFDVKVRGQVIYGPIEVVECDPKQEHFTYCSWHCSGYERKLCDMGLCYYEPMIFRNIYWYYKNFLKVNVAFACVTPMDEHGYFNFSVAAGMTRAGLDVADIIVLEVNENMPRICGGSGESIHISDVDLVVEGPHSPMVQVAEKAPSPIDVKIAENIIPHIADGSTIQLGIGGVPDAVGQMLAHSDLKDLGMHTELCSDAYLALFNAGKLTNTKKTIDCGKGVMGFATGTQPLYDWLNDNPGFVTYPVSYVNDPAVIGQLDNFVSINSCVSVDLYGQICSESAGTRHISGTGGQLDFVTGAAMSKGGKSFVCTAAAFTDKSGKIQSRIVPHFNGDIVTVPRSQAYFIVTEYGAVNLAGRSTWERTELLISVAAPEFRDDLVKAAQEQRIWRKSNKR